MHVNMCMPAQFVHCVGVHGCVCAYVRMCVCVCFCCVLCCVYVRTCGGFNLLCV